MSDPQQTPTLAEAIARVRAAHAGRAGTGASKRRGDPDYYRRLAALRKNPGRKPKKARGEAATPPAASQLAPDPPEGGAARPLGD